jgi:hypothetical protein
VATLSSWGEIMYLTFRRETTWSKIGVVIYFAVFIIICAFFTLNLFIGVVIDNFNRSSRELDGSAFLTPTQEKWRNTRRILDRFHMEKRMKPKATFEIGNRLLPIVNHPYFDVVVVMLIILNTATMLMHSYDETEFVRDFQYWSNVAFVIVFFLESSTKVLALGVRDFWHDGWNRLDLFVVVTSGLGLVITDGLFASTFQCFRIFRIFRVVKRAKNLKMLFQTLVRSLPSLWNIGSLLFVVFFVFAILGVNIFGRVMYSPNGFDKVGGASDC